MNNIGRLTIRNLFFSALVCLSFSALAHDDDIEGVVEKVDPAARSFVIKGQSIYVDGNTKYDDGLDRFEDIKVGDRLEVDVHNKDGRKVAHEIDRED
ncbi:DUF5666 domain-containing protein [Cupriavidus nantongensis]|uniref:DUF5666 domain-containing protein n=1 Tax=Cupriavidus nantongensis TaxID=1796606 RepID=UPI002247CEE8|nr:DUF5666 domain-containing protein [Cupriavidus nantongensis]